MQVNGKEDSEMVKVFRHGQMEQSTKASGKTIKRWAKESSPTWMVTLTKASGQTTKLMATASTLTSMEQCTRATGKTIFSTEWV